jgi:Leucine-rich repeat (LRR) protein
MGNVQSPPSKRRRRRQQEPVLRYTDTRNTRIRGNTLQLRANSVDEAKTQLVSEARTSQHGVHELVFYVNVSGPCFREVLLFPFLKILDLSFCLISSLPDEISQLRALVHLDVSFNRLCVLPNSITRLYLLDTLECETNLLRALPHDMTGMTSLIHIDFESNIDLLPCEAQCASLDQVPGFLRHTREHSRKRRAHAAAFQLLCARRFRRSELLNTFPRELVTLVARALVTKAMEDVAWDF